MDHHQILMTTLTLLREMLASKKKLSMRAVWKSCQWDSTDSTEKELFEMVETHGCPGSIEVNTYA